MARHAPPPPPPPPGRSGGRPETQTHHRATPGPGHHAQAGAKHHGHSNVAQHTPKLPGLPGARATRRQARRLAGASVQSIKSIRQQYGQLSTDVGGFNSALIDLLKQQAGDQSGVYNQLLDRQAGVNQEAASSLAALGGDYGAQLAAVQQARDASSSNLLATDAGAAQSYSTKLPGIAASRGELQRASIATQQQQALQQRADAFRQAYAQILPNVQAYNLNVAQARANLGLQQQQLSQNQQQFQATMQQRNQQMAQQHQEWEQNFQAQQAQLARDNNLRERQFKAQQLSDYHTYLARLAEYSGRSSGGMTATQKRSLLDHASTQIESLYLQGAPIPEAINRAVTHGVPRQIAVLAASRVYAHPPRPPLKTDSKYHTSHGKAYNHNLYNADKHAYDIAYNSYEIWVNKRLWGNQTNTGSRPRHRGQHR